MDKLCEAIGTIPNVYNEIKDVENLIERESDIASEFILSALASKYLLICTFSLQASTKSKTELSSLLKLCDKYKVHWTK